MIYLEAPNTFNDMIHPQDWLFLAGSITGAQNWQEYVIPKLIDFYNLANPRRANFDVTNPLVERQQITWEDEWLSKCGNIMFWFAPETLAPITLYELGKMTERAKNMNVSDPRIFIGIHPDYKRKNDILIQTELNAPAFAKPVFNLNELVEKLVRRRHNKLVCH